MTPCEERAFNVRRDRRPTEHLGREKMWQAMRVLRAFDRPQLAAVAECTVKGVNQYVVLLTKAGYLTEGARIHTGRRGGEIKTYRLVRDTGPKPPGQVGRAPCKAMFDHNENRLYEFQS